MIKVRNVSYFYNKKKVLSNIDFTVKKGEIVGIIGPNGVGKSTLMSLLATIKTPVKGNIQVEGCNTTNEQRAIQGIVYQEPVLDPNLTPVDILELQCLLYGVKNPKGIAELLKFFSLFNVRHNLIKSFSGGMKRKVELARALVTNPKILLLDEPTHQLDEESRIKFLDYIKSLGVTIIIASNMPEEVVHVCNRIIVLKDGRIIKDETIEPEKLILTCTRKFDCPYPHEWNKLVLTVKAPSKSLEKLPMKYINKVKLMRNSAYELFNF